MSKRSNARNNSRPMSPATSPAILTPDERIEQHARRVALEMGETTTPVVDTPPTPPTTPVATTPVATTPVATTPVANAPHFVVRVGQGASTRELTIYVNCRVDTPVDAMQRIATTFTSLYGGIAPCDMSFVDDHNKTHVYKSGEIVPRGGDAMKRKGKTIRAYARTWGIYGGENALRVTTRDTKYVTQSGAMNVARVASRVARNGGVIVMPET